jgi:glycosyltransferase involved in cell wall biosynthesis
MEAAVAIRSVRVNVVIPAMNEAENLPHVFPRLPDGLHEVIIVDGRSTDGTVEVARRLRPDVRIVKQDGKGKGNALAAGFAAATGDIFVTLDADGSTDAAEIPRFVSALCNGADFVKGSRFAQGGASSDITFTRRLGNRGPQRPRERPLGHELHRPLLRLLHLLAHSRRRVDARQAGLHARRRAVGDGEEPPRPPRADGAGHAGAGRHLWTPLRPVS